MARPAITREQYEQRAKQIHGDKYDYSRITILDGRTKIELVCPHHGSFFQRPDSHLAGNNCRKCKAEEDSVKFTISQEEILKRFKDLHQDKFDYSSVVYKAYNSKVEIKCQTHGPFWQTPNNHLKGHGCPVCRHINQALAITLTQEEAIAQLVALHGDRYSYKNAVYVSQHDKLEIICPEHGSFWQTPGNHLKGQGCPSCSRSKGEKFIETILTRLNIDFIPEYMIKGYRFRYDFYLPKLNVFIEFHGRQHYEPVEAFGGVESYKKTRDSDLFKKELVKLSGGRMLVFNYKQLRYRSLEKAIKRSLDV